jgi:hypothetical protein
MATRTDLAAASVVFPLREEGEETIRYAIFHKAWLPEAAVELNRNPSYQNDRTDAGTWTGGRVGQGDLKRTKYGISAASYPSLDVANLRLDEAKAIYERDFWGQRGCPDIPPRPGRAVEDNVVGEPRMAFTDTDVTISPLRFGSELILNAERCRPEARSVRPRLAIRDRRRGISIARPQNRVLELPAGHLTRLGVGLGFDHVDFTIAYLKP